MKRIVALCLAAACLISMVGCAGDTNMDEKKPNNSASAYALALASYPEMAPYPNEMEYFDEKTGEFDSDGFDVVYDAWQSDRKAQRSQPEGYADGLEPFFASSIREFLSNSNGENKVYSPLSVYMALAMLAEVTSGESREQILALLGSGDVDALRAEAAAVWNANYCDDGAVTSILANSLWLSDKISFKQETMDALAKYDYASSFRGEMGSAAFDKALQDWIDQQTGGLLKEQASGLTMDQETILALASTIYFRATPITGATISPRFPSRWRAAAPCGSCCRTRALRRRSCWLTSRRWTSSSAAARARRANTLSSTSLCRSSTRHRTWIWPTA